MTVFQLDISWPGGSRRLEVAPGANLRETLLASSLTPYAEARRRLNCRGMGVCGSCKVLVREGTELWQRRACQIRCFQDMEIHLECPQ